MTTVEIYLTAYLSEICITSILFFLILISCINMLDCDDSNTLNNKTIMKTIMIIMIILII